MKNKMISIGKVMSVILQFRHDLLKNDFGSRGNAAKYLNYVASEYIMKVRIRKTKIKYLPFKEIILIRFYFERTFVYAS